ncbi:class I SAM-dependent methyltransferase [Amycolatopsis regifaucium]|nr:class I SAM-dependent methyltransferase [Amycolatopsis regifaucium]SFH24616.1 Methyltransferase domain-containing protein [Amycolatopsis regifaucium]
MNLVHRKLCSSAWWAKAVAAEMPGNVAGFDLGDSVLEIGPGYGATTRALARLVPRLTAIEIDETSAELLNREFDGRVRIVQGDGAAMPFEDGEFSAVVCFTMLHHVPTTASQDAIFAEAFRVLRPGGVLRAIDSLTNAPFRLLHLGDTLNALDPVSVWPRLTGAGFTDIQVDHVPKRSVKFSARKPT